MSSIYKKGRDGYYYYQAYVYNPETNKKDKRVFKALSTKDSDQAKKKQIELDQKYEKDLKIPLNQKHRRLSNKTLKFFLVVIVLSLFSFLTIDFLYIKDFDSYEKVSNVKKNNRQASEQNSLSTEPTITKEIKLKIVESLPDTSLPKYSITKIEQLSSLFNQVKIFVTISNDVSSNQRLLVCRDIVSKNSEYTNIIIILLSDDLNNVKLADKSSSQYDTQNQKEYWLAMYTFNPVEGEYFDNNPGGYQSVN